MPCYLCSLWVTTVASNVVISNASDGKHISWGVGACECDVGDKAVPGKEHFQSTILIQKRETICRSKGEQTATHAFHGVSVFVRVVFVIKLLLGKNTFNPPSSFKKDSPSIE